MATLRRPRPTRPARPTRPLVGSPGVGRRARLVTPVLAAALALTGCSAANPITTTLDYSPSDGVTERVGDLKFGNLLVLAAEEGAPGTVLGFITNEGEEDVVLQVGVVDGEPTTLEIDGGGLLRLGPDQEETVEIESVQEIPGALMPLIIVSDTGGTVTLEIPVLDGTLPGYTELVPED